MKNLFIILLKKNLLLALAFLLIISGSTFAATKTWAGVTGTGLNWTTGTNWGGTAPVAGDDIVFNTAGTITFSTMPSNVSYNSLTISEGTVTLAHSSGMTITLGGNAGTDFTIASSSSLTIGTNVNITLASSATADISGTLTINSGRTYNTTAALVVTTVTGTIVNSGTITNNAVSEVVFQSGSTYQHNFANGGTVPIATWNVNSTVEIIGALTGTSDPGNLDQSFGNFTWNPVSQTSAVNLSGILETVNGNFTVSTTGSSELRLTAGSDFTLNIGGDFNLTGGTLNPVSGNNSNAVINISGDFNYTGGALTQSGGNPNTDAQFFFAKTGTQIYNSNGAVGGVIDFIVNSGAILSLGTNILNGRNFTLSSGGGIEIGSTAGITSSGATGNIQAIGTRTFNAGANYTYNGSSAQVTGNGLTTANNLTINNTAGGVTLSGAVTVNGTLTLTSGNIITTSFLLTLGSAATISGGSSSSYVDGPLAITGTGNKTFPIGKGSDYRPLTLGTIVGSTPVIQVELFTGSSGGSAGAGLTSISTQRYWVVSRLSGTYTSSFVTLTYEDGDGVTDVSDLSIGQSTTQGGLYQQIVSTASGAPSGSIVSDVTIVAPATSFYLLGSELGSNPLPVELTSFIAALDKNNVLLNWETATEVENYGFEVERTSSVSGNKEGDGEVIYGEWKKIGFVQGNGNSNSPKSYSYKDSKLPAGTYHFRLKQVDTDGSFDYSNELEVTVIEIPESFVLEQNYPNPFNPSTTIKFGIVETAHTVVKIYDAVGSEVTELFNEVAEGGKYYYLTFNASNYSSGVYYYTITSGVNKVVKKMLLLK